MSILFEGLPDGVELRRVRADAGGTETLVEVAPNHAFHVWAESDFVVFLLTRNHPEGEMIAPRNSNSRRWVLGPSALPVNLKLVTAGGLSYYLLPTAPVVEVLDDTPVENPAAGKQPLSLQQEMQRMIRTEMSRLAAEQGQETMEEADDFDEDEDDPLSQYQLTEMQVEEPLKRPAKASGKSPKASPESGAGSGTADVVKPPKEAEEGS